MASHVSESSLCPSDASDRAQSLQQLICVATTVANQAIDVLDNTLTSDEQLTTQSKYLPGSTIGKHLRHARDHYSLLLECIAGSKPRILNYDTRVRNTAMESERGAAKDAFLQTIRQLEAIPPNIDMEEPLTLNAVTPHMTIMSSTIGRELWFTSLHAVHHWSMGKSTYWYCIHTKLTIAEVRVIATELGLKVTEDLGFAPSTLLYKNMGKAKI